MDWDSAAVLNFIRQALEEDVERGDVTSLATVPENAMARVRISSLPAH
jgi:nicotinate-nucleotide pyrophosphorylase